MKLPVESIHILNRNIKSLTTTTLTLAAILLVVGCSSGNNSTTVLADDIPASVDNVTDTDNPEQDTETTIAMPSTELEEQATEMDVVEPDVEIAEPIAGIVEQPAEIVETFEPLQIAEATPAVLESLAGYQSDQLAPLVDTLSYEAIRGSVGQGEMGETLADKEFTTEDSRFGTVVTPIQRVRYNCTGGGTVVRETGRMRLDDISYTHIRNIDGYEFTQCSFSNEEGPLTSGDYTASGHLKIDSRSRSGPRFGEGDESFTWEQFDLRGPDSTGYELNGYSSLDSISGAFLNALSTREASFDFYRKREGDIVVESVSDSLFRQSTVSHQAGLYNSIEIQLSGTMNGSLTEGHDVLIQTDTLLAHTAAPDYPDFYQPFTGLLSLSSSDGGFLTLEADSSLNNYDPSENIIMDWSGAIADGTVISVAAVLLDDFTMQAPNCRYARTDDTAAYACNDESEQLFIP